MQYSEMKLDSIETEKTVIQTFANSAICTWQLQDKVIDVSTNPSPTTIAIPKLYQGLNVASAVMLEANKPVLPQSKLTVRSITARDFESTGFPNVYKGVIEVAFNASNTETPIKPIRIQQGFTFYTAGGATKISSCRALVSLPIIKCKVTSAIPLTAGWHYHALTAAQCGGVLPDASFIGMMTKTEVCGEEESWAVFNTGETVNSGSDFTANFLPATVVVTPFPWSGPGIAFYVRTPCPITPPSDSNIEITFLGTNF